MKIHCDVCNEDEASVYCTADEAALCAACDHRVHHANKLAGKHPRFSFILPTPKDSPLCDICQEKRAFLFCQQDRAILCKGCDEAIHKLNQHTKNHNRFLLTGVKLSPASSLYSSTDTQANLPTTKKSLVPDQQKSGDQKQALVKKPAASVPPPVTNQATNQATPRTQKVAGLTALSSDEKSNGSGHGSATTASSISEYLIEMLPGWHVEDFLDSPPHFSEIGDNDPMPFWDDDMLDGNLNSAFSPETMGMWVPQAPPPPAAPPPPQQPPPTVSRTPLFQQNPSSNMGFGGQVINGSSIVFAASNNTTTTKIPSNATKSSRKYRPDDGNCFTVPQISLPSTTSNRCRMLWQ